jgi:curved DNA-binding protein CbpA
VTDYYKILGLDSAADAAQVRAAFKKLAMEYHPDRNPGNKEAEELFKIVNEAYHTLSDPLKKSRYDAHLNPNPDPEPVYTEAAWREMNKRKYSRWQKAQQKKYVIDKDYFKIQALAFLVFVVIAGFCFAILNAGQYYMEQKRLKHYQANSKVLKQAGMLFNEGQFDDAFTVIHSLREKDPLEYRINFLRDSLVSELRRIANRLFEEENYSAAIENYEILKKHEQPVSFETIRQLSICQYYLGNYAESLQGMKRLHNQQPNSLDLVYSIGLINLEKLNNPQEALHYFSMGKKLFKENLSKVYGAAFEIIMDPNDAPDIYFDIFIGRARTNILLQDFDEAATDCNWAIYLRQDEGESYKLRAVANAGARKFESVCRDIRSARGRGTVALDSLENKYCR